MFKWHEAAGIVQVHVAGVPVSATVAASPRAVVFAKRNVELFMHLIC